MDQLWEYHYGLLSEAEAETLAVRIAQEPEVAAAYEQVRQSTERIAEAAKVVPSRPLTISAPEPEEKTNISPPPEVPEEISGTFTVVLESLPSSSGHLKPSALMGKPHFDLPMVSQKESRSFRNPFASRFSPQYARLNRILTISLIFLLVLTLTGFGLIRQTQNLLTNSLLQVQVVAPNQLARETQNTFSINVSDWRGLPKQVPMRVSLLNESGEKLALYQEKTDSKGSLQLALESPMSLSANAFVEISAGEEKTAQTIRRMIPVADVAPQQVESGEWGVGNDESPDFFALSQQNRINLAPHFSNAQNTVRFPSIQGQPANAIGGMGGRTLSPARAAALAGARSADIIPQRSATREIEMHSDSVAPEFLEETMESVAHPDDHFLQIEKWDDHSDESQTFPTTIRITDERGKPVAAGVRFFWWKGDAPQTEATPPTISFDNQRQFQAELESLLANRKPVFSEMLGFFTVAAILGGVIVPCVIVVLLFLRRLTGYTPLILAIVTGTTCVLLGVSLMHDQPVPAPTVPLEQSLASSPVPKDSENVQESEVKSAVPETHKQWTAESNVQGICTVHLTEEMTASSTLQVEALAPDERKGFAIWEIP